MEIKLPSFELVKKDIEEKTYYYILNFEHEEILLEIGDERGIISIMLLINGDVINLFGYYSTFSDLYAASENNFIIAIDLIQKYLKENNHI